MTPDTLSSKAIADCLIPSFLAALGSSQTTFWPAGQDSVLVAPLLLHWLCWLCHCQQGRAATWQVVPATDTGKFYPQRRLNLQVIICTVCEFHHNCTSPWLGKLFLHRSIHGSYATVTLQPISSP